MIFDANVHITETGEWFGSGKNASIENLLAGMQVAGVDKALLLPITGSVTNQFVSHIAAQYPDKLVAGASFNPAAYASVANAVDAFESEFSTSDTRIVKFHNRFGKYQPGDERFLKILESNNDRAQPLIIAICGFFNDKHATVPVIPPVYIFEIAKRFANTHFIIMHGAGSWIMKTAEMIRDLKNVFLDLSFTLSKYKGSSIDQDIQWLCANFDQRIIWGSDFPEYDLNKALNDFNDIAKDIDKQKRENILGGNLSRLLGNG